MSPLALVTDLEELDDAGVLGLDLSDAVAVLEVVTAASAALSAVSALAVEAVARRTGEELSRAREEAREEARQRGETVALVGAAQAAAKAADIVEATLAPVLHLTPRTTGQHLKQVRVLVNDLPATFALVRAGRLDLHRAGAVAAEGALVAPDLRDAFDREVLAVAGRVRTPLTDLTPGSVHRRAAAAAVRVDPDAAAARAQAALDKRHVRVRPGSDPGVSAWSAVLPADTSLQAWAAVDALASQYAAATPGLLIGQARADAMADLILAQATIRTHIELLVPYTPDTALTVHRELEGDVRVDSTGALERDPTAPTDPTARTAPSTGVTIRPGTRPASRCPTADDPDATCTTCAPPPPTDTAYERHLHLIVANGVRIGVETLTPLDTHLGALDPNTDAHPDLAPDPDPDPDPDANSHAHPEHDRPEPLGDVFLDPLEDLFADPLDDTPNWLAFNRPPLTTPTPDPTTCLIGVRHPRVGIILNTAVTAWLAHPDTRLRLAGHDPTTGTLTGHDPTPNRPGAALARTIRTRDGHCRFPGCTTDATRTDLDHVLAFPHGPTTATNLACLCRKHHTFKHHAGWTLTMTPDGTCTWTTPHGRTYTTHPRTAHDLAA